MSIIRRKLRGVMDKACAIHHKMEEIPVTPRGMGSTPDRDILFVCLLDLRETTFRNVVDNLFLYLTNQWKYMTFFFLLFISKHIHNFHFRYFINSFWRKKILPIKKRKGLLFNCFSYSTSSFKILSPKVWIFSIFKISEDQKS